MPLLELPKTVGYYTPYYTKVFLPAALMEFLQYISGQLVSENKMVEGINRALSAPGVFENRNQSSLNRRLTATPFSLAELEQARFAMMNSVAAMRLKAKGVLSLDDTLLT